LREGFKVDYPSMHYERTGSVMIFHGAARDYGPGGNRDKTGGNVAEDKIEIVSLDESSLGSGDVVCVRGAENKEGIDLKKAWLRDRFREGLKFKKLVVNDRSWGFIEYLPAESAWRPVDAPGYLFIDCIWVIGRQKGKGYGKRLLDECVKDAQGMNGVCVAVSDKPFMVKEDLFIDNGFEICDTAPPAYQLMVRKMKDAPSPKFTERAKMAAIDGEDGLLIIYSDQCPYTAKFMAGMIEGAKELGVPVKTMKITDPVRAREMPFVYGTCGVFYGGKLLAHGIMTRKEFVKVLTTAMK